MIDAMHMYKHHHSTSFPQQIDLLNLAFYNQIHPLNGMQQHGRQAHPSLIRQLKLLSPVIVEPIP